MEVDSTQKKIHKSSLPAYSKKCSYQGNLGQTLQMYLKKQQKTGLD